MFFLKELLGYGDIVIQCHNYPDADTIATAFAVYVYLTENGKRAQIVYSGAAEITKPNLLKMVELLCIPINYKETMPQVEALVLTDCQYGQGNTKKFDANNIFHIDHHEGGDAGKEYGGIVNSGLGSCSTLVWDLLVKEGFNFEEHKNVATALYYGLYTDTNSLEEITHPLDKDMRDALKYDRIILDTLRFNNLTIEELNIAGRSLIRHTTNKEYNFAVFQAEDCDQNILGFISDLAIQVENVDLCMVYSVSPNGYKLSVRSCTKEIMANEFAHFIAGGGGHKRKAGGFIPRTQIDVGEIGRHIAARTKEYFKSYELVYSDEHKLPLSSMAKYKKREVPQGYVLSTDVFPQGTPMLIRTMEGDEETEASENIHLMIGLEGEVYPIHIEKFSKSYCLTDQVFVKDYAYSPTVRNKLTGEVVPLIDYAKSCIPTGQTFIYAMPLLKNTKVFTRWNLDGYMSGKPGDFIGVRADDHSDVYILNRDVFYRTYDTF